MTAKRTAEEWGRVAVSLPGWPFDAPGGCGRMDTGIDYIPSNRDDWNRGGAGEPVPNPDDPMGATAGCLLALLGRQVAVRQRGQWMVEWRGMAPLAPGLGSVLRSVTGTGSTLGRACIAAAEALGRWPGGVG